MDAKHVIEDTSDLMHNANILASQYAIVRNILRQLPMKDLLICCTVCKLWRDIVDIVKKESSRYDSASFFWKGTPTDVSYYSQYPLFQSPQHKQMYSELDRAMAELMTRPRMVMVLGSGDTDLSVQDSNPGPEPEDHMEKSWLVDKGGVLARLPRQCHAIGTTSRGIVGVNHGAAVELENIYEESNLLCPAVSLMMIPEKPGCKILPFQLAENLLEGYIEEIKKDLPYLESEDVLQQKLLEKVIPDLKPTDKIRCLILLSNGLDLPFSMHILQAATRRDQSRVAIGGAVGDLCWSSLKDTSMLALMRELFYFSYQSVPVAENSYMSTSGFVIAGDNVQAASVMLQRKVRSEKRVMEELKKLKDSGICEDNSFAFMFACCGRGENHYRGKAGIEAGAFVKMFPRTPLIGIYGNGELGVSHVPDFKQKEDNSTTDNQKQQKMGSSRGRGGEYLPPGQFLHSFTTIFVMVSLGKV